MDEFEKLVDQVVGHAIMWGRGYRGVTNPRGEAYKAVLDKYAEVVAERDEARESVLGWREEYERIKNRNVEIHAENERLREERDRWKERADNGGLYRQGYSDGWGDCKGRRPYEPDQALERLMETRRRTSKR